LLAASQQARRGGCQAISTFRLPLPCQPCLQIENSPTGMMDKPKQPVKIAGDGRGPGRVAAGGRQGGGIEAQGSCSQLPATYHGSPGPVCTLISQAPLQPADTPLLHLPHRMCRLRRALNRAAMLFTSTNTNTTSHVVEALCGGAAGSASGKARHPHAHAVQAAHTLRPACSPAAAEAPLSPTFCPE